MMAAEAAVREEHLNYLRCPRCREKLTLSDARYCDEGAIEAGTLQCSGCTSHYPIVGHVPRFVSDEGYADAFGLEWTIHRRTQYDSASGSALSRVRFFAETGWPVRLDGEVIIEAGSGSGRFTEHAVTTGALVLSVDYSRAVDANHRSNGRATNLLLVQADLFAMPFPREIADRLFCFGVLQHTPDPRAALGSLTEIVRPGGTLVADIYLKSFARYVLGTKYWVRPLTRRVPPDRLYPMVARYIDLIWPLARLVRRIPRLGRAIAWRLLVGDHSDVLADDDLLKEWARLDTFDMLAPRYDKPARAHTVSRWCAELGLDSVDIKRGYNGLEIRARVPE